MKHLKGFHNRIFGNLITTMWARNLNERILRMQNHASIRELVWTLVPTFILILVAIPSIELLYMMDVLVEDDPVFTYKVIGHQWYWSYDYFGIFYKNVMSENRLENSSFDSYMLDESDTIDQAGMRLFEVDNPLILPAFNNIHFLVTSADVLHAWAVPSLGVKVDAIPGRINHICIVLKRVGTFYGQCSEICGVNHGFMPIKLEVFDLDDDITDFSHMFENLKRASKVDDNGGNTHPIKIVLVDND
jgi:cytochrome c oxidase subunit 2